ncbi:MAG: phage tail protein [Aromatoleum sp.]|uniref:phage tail protein n=1 Tax=Aromatoleum sp. TaxID=2307007 RepID=UPI002895D802|nr:phage tail protein [Aromatoleum sp.]MDT3671286.1 phage tail protein [Aromatoleum sp.]
MSTDVSRAAPVPAPPHDPYSLLLAGRIGPRPALGWRLRRSERVDIDGGTRALVLAPSPAAARWLSEADGSFGGLRPPPNVARTPGGDVLLLDPATGELERFDPCCGRFKPLPCTTQRVPDPTGCLDRGAAGVPSAPPVPLNRLLDARAIAVCAGELFIADRGHGRVVRLSLAGWVPRGALRLPPAQQAALTSPPWQPAGLAVDGHGILYVSDPANGRVDRFGPRGQWLSAVAAGLGVTHLALDCRDRLHAVIFETTVLSTAVGATTVALQLDALAAGFHWHTLKLSVPLPGARFAVALDAGDAPWTLAELHNPANPRWTPWLGAAELPRLADPLPLAGVVGRYLRLRLAPAPGHAATPPFDVIAAGARVVRIVGEAVEPLPAARADLVTCFPPNPIHIDARGHLHLCGVCGPEVFDSHGRPVPAEERLNGERYERAGHYLSHALDAGIDGCQWHRVELSGAIPPGAAVEVRTTTAAIELSSAEVDALPESAWATRLVATTMAPPDKAAPSSCTWDCLVMSPPGRFLWIDLKLAGDGRVTPCLSSALVEYPRISLRRYLPGMFGFDPVGADFTDRLTAIFDATLRSIEAHVDREAMLFDPLSAPADALPGRIDFLSWIADWIGVTLSHDWPLERRRHFVKQAAKLYCRRGTPDGLRSQLLLLLGFDRAYAEHCLAERRQTRCVPLPRNCGPCPPCTPAEPPPLILEHFKLRRWLYACHGRLGDDSVLWGKRILDRSQLSGSAASASPEHGNAQVGVTRLDSVPDPLRDPFHVGAYKFSVFVPARIRDSASEKRALDDLLAREAPAHTAVDVRYVEPRFRVGVQATIGLDAVIARTPCGVRLDEARLRQGTVLSGVPGSPAGARPPSLEVGRSRVGTSTRLA